MERNIDITKEIDKIRKQRGLTIEKLIQKTGITKYRMYNIRKTNNYNTDEIIKISKALGIRPSSLFEGASNTNKSKKTEELNQHIKKIEKELQQIKNKIE